MGEEEVSIPRLRRPCTLQIYITLRASGPARSNKETLRAGGIRNPSSPVLPAPRRREKRAESRELREYPKRRGTFPFQ